MATKQSIDPSGGGKLDGFASLAMTMPIERAELWPSKARHEIDAAPAPALVR